MSAINVHSTFFLKYLNMAWHVCLFLFFIIFFQFIFVIIFPDKTHIIDLIIKIISLFLMIGISIKASRISERHIKKAWFCLIFWALNILFIYILDQLQNFSFIHFVNPPFLVILLSLGNLGIIMAFVFLVMAA